MTFDLADFDTVTASTEGRWFPLLDPRNGEPTEAEFELYGPDSSVYRQALKTAQQKQMRRMREEGNDADPTFTTEEKIALLAPCVKNWRKLSDGGKEVPCSPDAVRRVLERYPIILRQIDGRIGTAANFLMQVKKTSQSMDAVVSG